MHELNVLRSMREDVPAPDLTAAQQRLEMVLPKGSTRPRRLALRAGLATGAAAAVAMVWLVPASHDRAPSGGVANPAGTPAMRLAAAAAASHKTSFRYTATVTSSADHWQQTTHGIYDPVSVQARIESYDTGPAGGATAHPPRKSAEWTIIGTDAWVTTADQPGKVQHLTVSPQAVPQLAVSGIRLPLLDASGAATVDPHDLIQALVSSGATIRDLGVSGYGAGAVHMYGYTQRHDPSQPRCIAIRAGEATPSPCPSRQQGPSHPISRDIITYTGTVSVGVQSGMIARVVSTQDPAYVPEVPPRRTQVESTIEYSDYGLPVHLTHP